jgi:gas vesicle protein
MYQRDRENRAGFAAGIVTGALVGAGVALLFAPRSGAEFREEVGESWSSLRNAVGRRYRDLADRAGVKLGNLQERIEQTARAVESRANEFINAAADTARDAESNRFTNNPL